MIASSLNLVAVAKSIGRANKYVSQQLLPRSAFRLFAWQRSHLKALNTPSKTKADVIRQVVVTIMWMMSFSLFYATFRDVERQLQDNKRYVKREEKELEGYKQKALEKRDVHSYAVLKEI